MALDTGKMKFDACYWPGFCFEPDGKIKFCACDDSPVIGNVWDGINQKYLDMPQNVCFRTVI